MKQEFDVGDAAALVGVTRSTVYAALRAGKIRGAYKSRHRWRLNPASVTEWHSQEMSRGSERTVTYYVVLPEATAIALHDLADQAGEASADLILRLVEAESLRRASEGEDDDVAGVPNDDGAHTDDGVLVERAPLSELLESRPRFELDYAIENYASLRPIPGGHQPSRQLQDLLAPHTDTHGSLRLGHLLSALRSAPSWLPETASLSLILAATEWTFKRLGETLGELAEAALDVPFATFMRGPLADAEPDELELHRQLSGIPLYDGALLSEVHDRVTGMHDDAASLRLREHDSIWSYPPQRHEQPWVLPVTDERPRFECRPACTIEAVRITLSGRDCGPVGLFVLSPGSYKQLVVFERDELGTDEPERVEVFGVALASCLDSLAFFVPNESFKPGDKIEVWARKSTFAEQREAAAEAAKKGIPYGTT